MPNPSQNMRVRNCVGQDEQLFVVEGDHRTNNSPTIADQFLTLGLFLQEHPSLSVSAVNIVNNWGRGAEYSYLAVALYGATGNIDTETKYSPTCDECGK
jgi:hypothetical protein